MNEIELSFFGEPVLFRTNSPLLSEVLAGCMNMSLPDPDEPEKKDGAVVELTVNEPVININSEQLPQYMFKAVNALARALNYRFLFLHACAFSHNQHCTVFSGPSGSGKTTLSMMAHHMGYNVLGEDLIALDWKKGHVFPILFPFRPRPFTRKLFTKWFGPEAKGLNINRQLGLKSNSKNFPISRLFLTEKENHIIKGMVKATFGHGDMPLHIITNQVATAVTNCHLKHCPQVHIDPFIDKDKILKAFRLWVESESMNCPQMIFKNRS